MAKKDNEWVIGIVVLALLVLFATNAQTLHFPFSIVSTQVCADGVTNYYSLDGNTLDSKGNSDAINNGVIFVSGKLGSNAVEFNGTNYISFPTLPSNLNVGYWKKDYSTGSDWIYITGTTSLLTNNFGFGFNGSVDEIVVGTTISNLSNIQPCYQTTVYENVTCKEYIDATVTKQNGCLSYTGDFYPVCSFSWQNVTTYNIENNLCKENFYCQQICNKDTNCYSTQQLCTENLKYECYIFSNNQCSPKTDYASCKTNLTNSYSLLSSCTSQIKNVTIPSSQGTITTSTTETTQVGFSELANKEIFNIFGYSITIVHIILVFILVLGIAYLLTGRK